MRKAAIAAFAAASVVLLSSGPDAWAVLTRRWTDAGYASFSAGECQDLSLASDGALTLAPVVKRLPGPALDAAILCLAQGPDGAQYAGTAFGGKVLVRRPGQDSFKPFAATGELMVTALVALAGRLWVGTAPNGRLLELDPATGALRRTVATGEQYVWAVVAAEGDDLLLATGSNGRLLHVAAATGQVTERWRSRQRHVLCLSRDREGRVLAGTAGEAGLLVRLDRRGAPPALALFQPPQPECRAVSVDPASGTVYLLATSGPDTASKLKPPQKPAPAKDEPTPPEKKPDESPTAASAPLGQPAGAATPGPSPIGGSEPAPGAPPLAPEAPPLPSPPPLLEPEPEPPPLSASSPGGAPAPVRLAEGSPTPAATPSGDDEPPAKVAPRLPPDKEEAVLRFLEAAIEKDAGSQGSRIASKVPFADGAKHTPHALYAIEQPSGRVTTLLSSEDRALFCAALDAGGSVLVGAGNEGLLYRVDPARRRVLRLVRVADDQILCLLPAGGGVLAGAAGGGHVWSIGPALAATGAYTSEVKKLPHAALFGTLDATVDGPAGPAPRLETRSGFAEEPDDTWSPWTPCTTAPGAAPQSACPAGRFFQYRALLTAPATGAAEVSLRQVEAYFRPQNLAPRLEELEVATAELELSSSRGELQALASGKPPEKGGRRPPNYIRKVSWKASDPNGDKLLFDVQLKAEGDGEEGWYTITDEPIEGTGIVWETNSLPDGRYRLKVKADDSPANFALEVLRAELVSSVFTIDNTPPRLLEVTVTPEAGGLRVRGAAADAQGRVINAEYSLDGDYYQALAPADGLFDQGEERFSSLVPLEAGKQPRTLAVKVFDELGNTGQARLVLRAGQGTWR